MPGRSAAFAWLVERLRRRPWLYRLAVGGYDQWLLWRRRSETIPALLRCLSTRPTSLVRSLRHFSRLHGWRGIRHALRYHTAVDGSWSPAAYRRWSKRSQALLEREHSRLRDESSAWPMHPRISLLLPVAELDLEAIQRTLRSVTPLLGPNVELCIAASAAVQSHLAADLAGHPHVRIVVADSNSPALLLNAALAVSSHEYVARIDVGDELEPAAPLLMANALRHDDCDILYSDEDLLDARGRPSVPVFKTAWDPEQMLAQDCVGRMLVLRGSLAESVGGWREEFAALADYDLVLRCGDATTSERIRHLSRMLYHRPAPDAAVNPAPRLVETAPEPAALLRCETVRQHLKRRGANARIEWNADVGATRVRWGEPTEWPLVSAIIPTRDRIELLRKCVEGLFTQTDYPHLEILIVDHDSREPATHAQLAAWQATGRVGVIPYTGAFNHSAMNNLAAREARGSVLCLLNNDIEPIHADWLRELVTQAVREDIGAVGAKLIYPDNTLQHAGVVVGWGGVAGHVDAGLPRDAIAPGARTHVPRSVSAVTAACLVIRKAEFQLIGGFDVEAFPIAFNDVDLCLRLEQSGLRNVWTPHAELYHHESASLGSPRQLSRQQELQHAVAAFHERWGREPRDAFYNENLSLWHADARPVQLLRYLN